MIRKMAGITAGLMLFSSAACIGILNAEEVSDTEEIMTETDDLSETDVSAQADEAADTEEIQETELFLSDQDDEADEEQWCELDEGVCSIEDISLLQPSYIDDFLYRDIIKGDVNGDGCVDLSDLTMFSQYLLKDWDLTYEQLIAADIVCQRYSQAEPDIADFAALKQIICNDYIGLEYRPDYFYVVAR